MRTEPRPTSNYVYIENIPLLAQRESTYFRRTDKIKTILYDDLYRCVDQYEATKILEDPYAFAEMKRHLSARYGEVAEGTFLNYDIDNVLITAGFKPNKDGEVVNVKDEVAEQTEDRIA